MKKIIVIQDNEVNDALGEAFDIVGEEDFECVRKLNPLTISKVTEKINKDTKWIIIEDTSSLMYAWTWFCNGFKLPDGEKIDVSVIFIKQLD